MSTEPKTTLATRFEKFYTTHAATDDGLKSPHLGAKIFRTLGSTCIEIYDVIPKFDDAGNKLGNVYARDAGGNRIRKDDTTQTHYRLNAEGSNWEEASAAPKTSAVKVYFYYHDLIGTIAANLIMNLSDGGGHSFANYAASVVTTPLALAARIVVPVALLGAEVAAVVAVVALVVGATATFFPLICAGASIYGLYQLKKSHDTKAHDKNANKAADELVHYATAVGGQHEDLNNLPVRRDNAASTIRSKLGEIAALLKDVPENRPIRQQRILSDTQITTLLRQDFEIVVADWDARVEKAGNEADEYATAQGFSAEQTATHKEEAVAKVKRQINDEAIPFLKSIATIFAAPPRVAGDARPVQDDRNAIIDAILGNDSTDSLIDKGYIDAKTLAKQGLLSDKAEQYRANEVASLLGNPTATPPEQEEEEEEEPLVLNNASGTSSGVVPADDTGAGVGGNDEDERI